MTIKELFKLIEKHNEMVELIGGDRMVIETIESYATHAFETLKEYKKYLKEEIFESAIKSYLEMEYVQDDKYKNYFHGTYLFDNEAITIELIICEI